MEICKKSEMGREKTECTILFSFSFNAVLKKKKKLTKNTKVMFVIVCLPMPYDLAM